MDEKTVTIIDVAQRAGVSKGTVDRVLHNRGEVSKKSAEKVRKAIEELNYEPNLYASLLATKKARIIAGLIPRTAKGEYWEMILEGFRKGGEKQASMSIHTQEFFYDQYDVKSFKSACAKILNSADIHGVVITPLFKIETMQFVQDLKIKGIPYAFVDTKIEDNGYLAYFGMPMYKSGYLCADLLTHRCRQEDMKKVLVVRIKRDKGGQSDPTGSRREGFNDFMGAFFPETEIVSVHIDPSNPTGICKELESVLEQNPDINGIVTFNSRVHLLGEFLAKHKRKEVPVIGFDALKGNMAMLQDGRVDILIAQHPENQSLGAVEVLSDEILMHKSARDRDNYVHMDILTRLNQDNY